MRELALAVGVVATLGSWYVAEVDSLATLVLFTAYLFAPWAFLAFGRLRLGHFARGAAVAGLALMAVGMYVSVAASDSSTAALGLVALPVYQGLAVAGVVGFGRWNARRTSS